MKRISITLVVTLISFVMASATPNKGLTPKKRELKTRAAGCDPTTAVIDLDVNNVRARLMTGGDMWWDRSTSNASYEVPKGSNKNALYAGSIWVGGKDIDQGNQLRVAAQTYRQSGNDYWAGPLNDTTGSILFQTCADWDRFWKISAADVSRFRSIYAAFDVTDTSKAVGQAIKDAISGASVPDIIKEWPARGNKGIKSASGQQMQAYNQDLAEFVNVRKDDGDDYHWENGDYPKISGDQYIWWVFNDKGDAKTETTSESMGLEIHAAAFAFATNDCLNEATFYNYKIKSKSNRNYGETYMATWNDADLGYAFDDFVGCDTTRGLGILYNGDSYDDGSGGYGYELPMVGVDFFQGPKFKDPVTQKDTELKMTVFTYYDNISGPTGNPDVLDDYYQYMTGFWKDGQPFTTACNARTPGPATKFIFYGDPCRGGWTEATAPCSNTPNDRRFIHSSGPFPLDAGAEASNITIGAIWVPNVGGGTAACFSKIQVCDDKAQDLFDNEFKLPFGPMAPKVTVQPSDKRLIFDLDNLPTSNNYGEGYGTDTSKRRNIEVSQKAKNLGIADSIYKFEGYVVYQLKNSTVAISDIRSKDGSVNADKARVVFQCDKKNGIKKVVNFEQNTDLDKPYFSPQIMVEGSDNGISHSFQINQDAFATGTSKSLINYKYYYYIVVAYAHNNFKDFDPGENLTTQNKQYIESRTDGNELPIKVIRAMPHPATDSLYIQNYAEYGTGLQLTRIEGIGNNGIAMDLTDASEQTALAGPNYRVDNPTYKPNAGPMKVSVVFPDSIKPGNYEVWFKVDSSVADSATFLGPNAEVFDVAVAAKTKWAIRRVNGTQVDTIWNDIPIAEYNEKYLRKYNQFDWGIAASATQQIRPGESPLSRDNGLITSSVTFDDVNLPWLSGIPDIDGKSFLNWIRAGVDYGGDLGSDFGTAYDECAITDFDNVAPAPPDYLPIVRNQDQLGTFEGVINGTFAPYNLVTNSNLDECGWGKMYGNGNDRSNNRLQHIYSIDLVFTADKSKWSRCPVIEMTDHIADLTIAQGGAYKYNMRKHLGWNGEINADGSPKYSTNTADSGMSMFPGYAINVETGERLNVFFGEESYNVDDRGNDMLWNPTNIIFHPVSGQPRWAGKHIIYVARTKYDGGEAMRGKLQGVNVYQATNQILRSVYRSAMWVGSPLLRTGTEFTSLEKGMIPTTTRVKIRVTRPYAKYAPGGATNLRNGGWPLYTFNTDGMLPIKVGDAGNSYTNNKDEIFKRISVVPNPYYAYSEYEENRLENKVRIINLPEKATVKIFTTEGVLIKTIKKSDSKTSFVDWDIKNEQGIPIASGMYLVHVQLDGIGETILKWFGAMRPIDITSF